MASYLCTSASARNGGVFLVDSDLGTTRRVLGGSFRGLTRGPDGAIYVVAGSRNDPSRDRAVVHRLEPADWTARQAADLPYRDSHDLRWIDGSFYLVASVGNYIIRLDAAFRELERMQIVPDERDVCHVNCLLEREGALYACIFTLSPGERREKRRTGAWSSEGKLLLLDFPRGFRVCAEPLAQPHSPLLHAGGVLVLESHLSRLTVVEPDTGAIRPLATYHGFLRGLCAGPDELLIGTCRILRRDWAARVSPWRRVLDRWFPFSGLLVVDPRTWRLRKRISLPDSEPYDLLCLP